MNISEKIETIDNKIDQNKAQYDLDRQTVKIWIFTFRQIIESTSWRCKETVSKIR